MSHTCHIIDCPREIPPRMFACLRHWKMVSPALQRALDGIADDVRAE